MITHRSEASSYLYVFGITCIFVLVRMETSWGHFTAVCPRLTEKCDLGDCWLNHHISHNTATHGAINCQAQVQIQSLKYSIQYSVGLDHIMDRSIVKPSSSHLALFLAYNSCVIFSTIDSVQSPYGVCLVSVFCISLKYWNSQNIDDFINQFVVDNSHTSVFLWILIQFKLEQFYWWSTVRFI